MLLGQWVCLSIFVFSTKRLVRNDRTSYRDATRHEQGAAPFPSLSASVAAAHGQRAMCGAAKGLSKRRLFAEKRAQGRPPSQRTPVEVTAHAAGTLHCLRLYEMQEMHDKYAALCRERGLNVAELCDVQTTGAATAPTATELKDFAAWLEREAYNSSQSIMYAGKYTLRLPATAFVKGRAHGVKQPVRNVLNTFARLWASKRLTVFRSSGLGVKATALLQPGLWLGELTGVIAHGRMAPGLTAYNFATPPKLGTLCGSASLVNAACASCANVRLEQPQKAGDGFRFTDSVGVRVRGRAIGVDEELRAAYAQHDEGEPALICPGCGKEIVIGGVLGDEQQQSSESDTESASDDEDADPDWC